MAGSSLAEQVGRVLAGRYRLLAPIGRGASGQVYLADDVTLVRRVAVKLLHGPLADDPGFLKRFRAEARAAAALSHPHVVAVFDWGEDDGEPYLVLEYLGGGSLRGLLDRSAPLSLAQVAGLGIEAGGALAYAHRRGVVHRDIKPANLLFGEDGALRVADFGLARALAEAAWTEPVGVLIGTARYASPEQAQGHPLDGRSDVYALGLVLLEAATGELPFGADTALGTLMARLEADPEVPGSLGVLAPVLRDATRRDPAERLDAPGLLEGLRSAARRLPSPAPLVLAPGTGGSGPASGGTAGVGSATAGVGSSTAALEAGTAALEAGTAGLEAGTAGLEAGTAGAGAPDRTAGELVAAGGEVVAGRSAALDSTAEVVVPAEVIPASGRTRRRGWRVAALAVVIALLAAGGSFAALRFLVVPSAPVPPVVGMPPAAATAVLTRVGHWKVQRLPSVYDSQVAAGRVASQQPGAGRSWPENRAVGLVLSLGPAPRPVPSLAHLDQNAALSLLSTTGFTARVSTAYSQSVPAGSVISWSPRGVEPYGSTVNLVVSDGPPPVTVPSLAGLSYAGAAAKLATLHLSATEVTEFSTQVRAGAVITTEPSPGATVPQGTLVTVLVSKGPQLVRVPDLEFKSVATAQSLLQAAGLSLGAVYGPSGSGVVIDQTPAPGSMVAPGTTVNLYTL